MDIGPIEAGTEVEQEHCDGEKISCYGCGNLYKEEALEKACKMELGGAYVTSHEICAIDIEAIRADRNSSSSSYLQTPPAQLKAINQYCRGRCCIHSVNISRADLPTICQIFDMERLCK